MQARFSLVRSLSTATQARAALTAGSLPRQGDPGPQAAKFRKSQRHALREGRNSTAIGLDELNTVLGAETSDGPRRKEWKAQRRFNGAGRVPTPTANDAYATSIRLKKIIRPKRPGPLTSVDIENAIKLVYGTPRAGMSVPVWNMLLGAIGKEGRFEVLWKTFNDMKKRGFQPNTRTYTTMLNAYAGIRHSLDTGDSRLSRPVEGKTPSRVSIIYDQAQAYLSERMAEVEETSERSDLNDTGLATDALPEPSATNDTTNADVNVGPTNAYLKFLASIRRYKEMDNVFVAMPASGPLSPDIITYTTMLSAMIESLNPKANAGGSGMTTSPTGLWGRMCRQFLSTDSETRSDPSRSLDQTVILVALKCLVRSDQQSQQTAMDIIDSIWGLPRSARDPSPMLRGNQGLHLPRLPLTVEAATTIMAVCPKATDRSHYAHLFLGRSDLQSQFDTPFYITAIRALSETGDIQDVMNILDTHQPRRPNHWPVSVWHDALTAARWSKNEEQGMKTQPDFNAGLAVFRRMTGMPSGVEHGSASPDREHDESSVDAASTRRAKANPPPSKDNSTPPDAKALSLLLKIALGRGWREVEQAINVVDYYMGTAAESAATSPSGRARTRAWDQELAKDIVRASERLLERQPPPQVVKELKKRIKEAEATLSKSASSASG